jgi:hypothetical protein
VTNAVLHSGGDHLFVALAGQAGHVTVLVHDHSPDLPTHLSADPDAENGRGVLLVGALATAHGWFPGGRGKVVWASLALRRHPVPTPARAEPTAASAVARRIHKITECVSLGQSAVPD